MAPGGAPTNEGDGLRMALSVGAALGNMSEAWWCPAIAVPGEHAGGAPYYRMLFLEYTRPGCLLVDQNGRRFADEAQNYNDLGRALLEFSPTFQLPRVPAWLIFDSAFRRRYGLGQVLPARGEDPEYIARAESWAELAALIGVPAQPLGATVERFNNDAADGHDAEFGRGAAAWGRHMGDATAPHPNVGPLRVPPFYAARILPGALATKGGPRTDAHARVLRSDDSGPIPGLFAAGNVSASPFGLAYPGGGSTIGPAIVFGWLAGTTAASEG
jgi:succinate dehydrogenase/fumarate reductase flavoprotein subunit